LIACNLAEEYLVGTSLRNKKEQWFDLSHSVEQNNLLISHYSLSFANNSTITAATAK
jgi:hypothetical protein